MYHPLQTRTKPAIRDRYSRDAHGDVLIEVSADCVADLYNCFDRHAPYIRRDLEGEFVQYLIDCAGELEGEPFRVNIILAQPADSSGLSRVIQSMYVYFQYLAEKERQTITGMIRKSLLLAGVGLMVLSLAVWINQWLGIERSVVANVFGEGLTIVAWVSLWEALSTFLVEWFPRRKKVALYGRLSKAPLSFTEKPDASPHSLTPSTSRRVARSPHDRD